MFKHLRSAWDDIDARLYEVGRALGRLYLRERDVRDWREMLTDDEVISDWLDRAA